MAVSAFGYLGIGVSDMERWREFATTGVLGMEETETAPDGTVYMRIDEYHHRFAFHPTGEDDLVYIGWEVPTAQALEETADKIRAAGATVTEGSAEERANRKVVKLYKFKDTNGILMEIFHGGLQLWEQPFKPSRPISGFRTKSEDGQTMGLGHMVIFVKDSAATLAFYRDVLGMKVSDYIDLAADFPGMGMATFFHVNPRHHTVAIAEVPQAPKILQHFMLELNNFDDVGHTFYLCQDQGVPLSMSLGKHTNDHMTSFYLQTPSGFDIEYGWGGRLIDDEVWVVQQHVKASVWGHRPVERPVAAAASDDD